MTGIEKLDRQVAQAQEAVGLLLQRDLLLPALTVLYATIDAMAWLLPR
jgi:hypothetical protein